MNNDYYITTPIYYVNDKPHIGHAYTTILADVMARYNRNSGKKTFFLTGLDEHGQKVQNAAELKNILPQEHCDKMAPRFLNLWKMLRISNDDFIRTTQQRHKDVVQDILNIVMDKGDIYQDEYEGLYSVSEERFITAKEAESGQFRSIKKLKEKNYFFRMSKYQQRLIDYIEANPSFIKPKHRKNEILGFLQQPLNDLCISRPKERLNWGIELPFDKKYVTYVWFDALINYITAAGYNKKTKNVEKWWPASCHLIGKDILTTHAVYWPTILFSAGIDLPHSIFAHGWWLMEDAKMSKSIGNVINPMDLLDTYGVDSFRYYLMREMVLGHDSNFTIESFKKRYNSDLANDFGNCFSRVTTLINKNFNGIIPKTGTLDNLDHKIKSKGQALPDLVSNMIDNMRLNEAIEEIMQYVRSVNKYMEKTAPWKIIKEDKYTAGKILYVSCEALRLSAVLLSPIMPHRTKTMLDILNVKGGNPSWGKLPSGNKIKEHTPIFPRIK